MEASVTIRFDKPLPDGHPAADYPAFAANWGLFDEVARELETFSPFDFVSETPEEYAQIMKDVKAVEQDLQAFDIQEIKANPEFKKMMQDLGDDPTIQGLMNALEKAQSPEEMLGQAFPAESPGEEWYDAAEGVDFLNRLSAHVEAHPRRFENVDQLNRELADLTQLLRRAEQQGVKFYFALQG
jgi:hypothetical protein